MKKRKEKQMGSLYKQNALALITLFSGAVKGMTFYPASHPAIKQPLMELHTILTRALDAEEQVSWGLIDGIMFFGDHLFVTPSTTIADLTNRMMEKEIGRIIVTSPISFDELEKFVKLFAVKGVRCEELSHQMEEQGITSFRLVRQGEEMPVNDTGEFERGSLGGDVETYGRALSTIRTICSDIERGRIPNSAPLITVVDQMTRITMQEPWALLGLTMIKDYDSYTFNHCVNVGILAMALGSSLGLDAAAIRDLGIAGQLHDIGKTMIPKTILNKPGKLSGAEFEEMKRHPELGAKIIREMAGFTPRIASMVLGHHLHHDRSGYPEWSRDVPSDQMIDIIATADTYDAITTLRAYQRPVNPRTALNVMQKLAHTILDTTIVGRFVELMGTYPVGTLVRLDTNEIAAVHRPNPLDEEAPLVRILIDGTGKRLHTPHDQALICEDGSYYARIVAIVDPLLKNIDIGRLIADGNY